MFYGLQNFIHRSDTVHKRWEVPHQLPTHMDPLCALSSEDEGYLTSGLDPSMSSYLERSKAIRHAERSKFQVLPTFGKSVGHAFEVIRMLFQVIFVIFCYFCQSLSVVRREEQEVLARLIRNTPRNSFRGRQSKGRR